ncbi:hypothetical protein PC9H_009234, partial [Pleurotus ostreatus]
MPNLQKPLRELGLFSTSIKSHVLTQSEYTINLLIPNEPPQLLLLTVIIELFGDQWVICEASPVTSPMWHCLEVAH